MVFEVCIAVLGFLIYRLSIASLIKGLFMCTSVCLCIYASITHPEAMKDTEKQ